MRISALKTATYKFAENALIMSSHVKAIAARFLLNKRFPLLNYAYAHLNFDENITYKKVKSNLLAVVRRGVP